MNRGFSHLLILLVVFSVIGAGFFFFKKNTQNEEKQFNQFQTQQPQAAKTTFTPEDTNQKDSSFVKKLNWDTSEWITYANGNLNISFKYPNDLVYEENPRNLEGYKNVPYFFTKQTLNDYKECIRLSKSDPPPITRDWELGCDRKEVLFMISFHEYKDQEIDDIPSNHFLPSIEIVDSQQRKWNIQSNPGYFLGVRAISQNQAGNRLYLALSAPGNKLLPYLEKAFLLDENMKNTDEKYQMTLMAAFLREIVATFKHL